MSVWGRVKQSALLLWERAKREHSTPREIACSFGLGVFSGCTPAFGFHMWVAMGLATLFRLNRLWAFLGSRVSFTPLYAWIVFCEVEAAHRLRTGAWAPLAPTEAAAHAWDLVADWLIGVVLIGGALGLAAGVIAYGFAARNLTRRMPGGPPRVTSESPPSAPPAHVP